MATGFRPPAVTVTALVALALAGAPPASAQRVHGGFGGGRLGGRIGGGHVGAVPFGNGGFGFLRPPLWSGLIEQNFAFMRATSPFPNQFAGGMFNRRPFFRHFGPAGFNAFVPSFGDFSFGGYGYGYSPSFYAGYGPALGSYSTPQYLPQPPVIIIEREVVREPGDREPRQPEQIEKGEPAQPSAAEEGYYLAPKAGETPEDAVAEIRRAWMSGDYARLKSRLPETGKMRIYLEGKYRYSVDAAEFAQMTREAMARIDTISFTLDRVARQGEGRAFVSGKHSYYDPARRKHAVYVSYGLVREKGRWNIAEAGSSREPVTSHAD
jgi:hypothetical protein